MICLFLFLVERAHPGSWNGSIQTHCGWWLGYQKGVRLFIVFLGRFAADQNLTALTKWEQLVWTFLEKRFPRKVRELMNCRIANHVTENSGRKSNGTEILGCTFRDCPLLRTLLTVLFRSSLVKMFANSNRELLSNWKRLKSVCACFIVQGDNLKVQLVHFSFLVGIKVLLQSLVFGSKTSFGEPKNPESSGN